MLAQSVFTHLKPVLIEQCLTRVVPRLTSDGTLYATYYESEDDEIFVGAEHGWWKNYYKIIRYPFHVFEELATKSDCTVEHIGDWGHPRGQQMMIFRR